MKTKLSTRFLSLMLCVLMCVSLVPAEAFAEAEGEYSEDFTTEEVEEILNDETGISFEEFEETEEPTETVTNDAALASAGTCGEDLTWSLDDEGTLTISGSGAMDDYFGWSEPSPWYTNRSSVKNVIIADSVTSVGSYAFYECDNLTGINFGDGVAYIGEDAFNGCRSLTEVSIGNGVITIDDNAFSGCSSLAAINFGESVTSIGRYAFSGCSSLPGVTFSDCLESIGNGAFSGCSSLTEVTIPAGVTDLPGDAFANCGSLTTIDVDAGNAVYSSQGGVIYNKEQTTLILCPAGKTGEYEIPLGATKIGREAFNSCSALTRVIIPSSVTEIGYSAFSDCSGLTEVTVPDSVTKIGSRAFKDCSKLSDLVIGNAVEEIAEDTFSGCTGLTSVTIPASVTTIGAFAFYKCTGLTEITIGDGLTSIAHDAFYDCENLTDVYYNGGLEGWLNIDFAYGANPVQINSGNLYINGELLTNAVIPSTVTAIKPYAFYGYKNLTDVTIPSSVTEIGEFAFSGCTGLTNVNIQPGVTSIGRSAFEDCTGLTEITIPSGVTQIGDSAFDCCYLLEDVTIMSGLTSLENNLFRKCINLTGITIPDSVTSVSSSAFSGCLRLEEIDVDSNNTCYSSVDGVLFNKDKTSLILCPAGKAGEYTVPSGVIEIGASAFSGCTKLTGVSVPDGVTVIGQSAFSDCTYLTEVTIPDSVTSLGISAFSGCSSLKSVNIPGSIAEISESAFYCCFGLKSVTIASGVTSIGKAAFSCCEALYDLTIPSSVTSIGNNAFAECDTLKYITLSASVKIIGGYAFYDCDNLTSVKIWADSPTIGECAFAYCSSLKNVTFKGDAPAFGNDIFRCDYYLTGNTLTVYYPANNATWTSDLMQNYGGEVLWVAKNLSFTLGVDSNSFANSNSSTWSVAGFKDFADYALDSEFLDEIAYEIPRVDTQILKNHMHDTWGGSCYGMAMTMGLLFEHYVTIYDLTHVSAENYYSMPYPCDNYRLRCMLAYYQISQLLTHGGRRASTVSSACSSGYFGKLENGTYYDDTLPVFLEKLVNYASTGTVAVLGVATESGGHAVLVTGCDYDEQTGQYKVHIFDENSVRYVGSVGEITDMTIEADFSSFSYVNANNAYYRDHGDSYETIDNDTYKYIYLLDWDKLEDIILAEETSEHAYLTFLAGQDCTVVNAEGKYISYNTSGFSGDMNVYDVSVSVSDNSVYYILETDDSASFTVTGSGAIELDISNDDSYLALQGSGFDSATLTPASGIALQGDSYSFRATIGTDAISDTEDGLLAVSADATSDVTLTKQNNSVTVKADEPLDNIVTTDYVGAEATETVHESSADLTVVANTDPDTSVPEELAILTQSYLAMAVGEQAQLQLTDEATAAGIVPAYTSEDISVASVDANGLVTARKAGTTNIVCTVTANGTTYSAFCRIDVTEAPVAEEVTNSTGVIKVGLGQTAAAVNVYSTDYTEIEIVPMLQQNMTSLMAEEENTGAAVTAARFADPENGTNPLNELFTLRVKDDRTLVIVPKDGIPEEVYSKARTLAKSYTSRLIITIDDTEFETTALKLSVSATLPKLTAKTVKFNTADPQNAQTLKISGANITGLSWKGDAPTGLELSGTTIALAAENAPTKSGKFSLLAEAEGWAVPIAVSVSYTVSKTAPTLKLKSTSLSVLSGSVDSASTTYTVSPADFTGVKYSVQIQGITETVGKTTQTVENGTGLTVTIDENKVVVTAPDAEAKAHTYTVSLAVINNSTGIKVSKAVKLTVKVLAASTAVKVTPTASGSIDTAIKESPIKLTTKLSGFHAGSGETWSVRIEQYKAKTKTTAEIRNDVTDQNLFNVIGDNGNYVLTQADGAEIEKGYTYNVYVMVDIDGDGTVDATSKAVKLSVKWSSPAKVPVSVTLKASGSIDPLRPASTITLKPSFKNCYDYDISADDLVFIETVGKVKTTMTAADENCPFTVNIENGRYILQEKYMGAANTSAKYSVKFVHTVREGEAEVKSTAITLTVKAGKTVIVQSDKTVSLIKADRNDTAIIRLTPANGQYAIDASSVMLDSTSAKYYSLINLGNGYYEIGFKDNAVNAKAKSLTAKITVKLQGAPATNKGTTVSVKINLVSVK